MKHHMDTNNFLYLETINCIPSKDLREYLKTHIADFSIMQKATIIENYADSKLKIQLFRQLADFTSSVDEKELLLTAITEIQNDGCVNTNTNAIYNLRFQHEGSPFYPFLEVCYINKPRELKSFPQKSKRGWNFPHPLISVVFLLLKCDDILQVFTCYLY